MSDIEYLKKYVDENLLEESIKRLKNGEPVQYIVGNVDFYDYNFDINKDVLIPRFETEELVSDTVKYIKKYYKEKVDILDIGTGSGCIAITLYNKVNSNVDGIDISKDAIVVAKKNNIKNNSKVNFYLSDIFSNVNKKYDVIVSNPPYISKKEEIMDIVKNNEPHIALYASEDGLYFYKKILSEIKKYLKEKYIIAFEIGSHQENSVREIAKLYFPDDVISSKKDYNGLDRYLYIIHQFDN